MNAYCSTTFDCDCDIEEERRIRKVSRYRDYNHEIAREIINCKEWLRDIEERKEYFKRICRRKLINYYHVLNSKKYARRIADIKKGNFTKCMMESVFQKNRFYIYKTNREDNVCLFDRYDVYKFFLVLIYTMETKELEHFIDIPDVFYIIRQLRRTNLKYYFDDFIE